MSLQLTCMPIDTIIYDHIPVNQIKAEIKKITSFEIKDQFGQNYAHLKHFGLFIEFMWATYRPLQLLDGSFFFLVHKFRYLVNRSTCIFIFFGICWVAYFNFLISYFFSSIRIIFKISNLSTWPLTSTILCGEDDWSTWSLKATLSSMIKCYVYI